MSWAPTKGYHYISVIILLDNFILIGKVIFSQAVWYRWDTMSHTHTIVINILHFCCCCCFYIWIVMLIWSCHHNALNRLKQFTKNKINRILVNILPWLLQCYQNIASNLHLRVVFVSLLPNTHLCLSVRYHRPYAWEGIIFWDVFLFFINVFLMKNNFGVAFHILKVQNMFVCLFFHRKWLILDEKCCFLWWKRYM